MVRLNCGGFFARVATVLIGAALGHTSMAGLPNGVAAGDVSATGAVLWARSDAATTLHFEYGTDPTFASVIGSADRTIVEPLVPAKVVVERLTPGVEYYYRCTDQGGASESGRFRTPALTAYHGFRLGVSGDWRGELAPYPAIRNVALADLDLWVSHGDTIYADVPSPAVPLPQAVELVDYRLKHEEPLAERMGLNTFRELRRSTALLANIDDHEVTNDFQGGAHPSSDPRFASEMVNFINETTLYQRGLQAFTEYHPMNAEVWSGTGEARFDGKPRLYRYRRYGRDAAVFVVDARSFRDEGLPAVTNPSDPVAVLNFILATFTPGRQFVGGVQLAQLQNDLVDAEQAGVTWKFVHIPEPTQNLGVLAASDRYEGYAAERTQLLAFIRASNIRNVVFVAADIHGTVTNEVQYQTFPGGPQIGLGAFEISTGSVAYAAPFGPTIIGLAQQLGLLTPAQIAFYNSLPRFGKDDFVASLINPQLELLGYPLLGLTGSADVTATLLSGSYWPMHTFGWTLFEVNPASQALTVTTFGIDWYSPADLANDPAGVLARTPEVVSRFRVLPQVAYLRGDLNCDGIVSVTDIGPFVLALTDPVGYAVQYPGCEIERAEINGDGAISPDDIGRFVQLVIGG